MTHEGLASEVSIETLWTQNDYGTTRQRSCTGALARRRSETTYSLPHHTDACPSTDRPRPAPTRTCTTPELRIVVSPSADIAARLKRTRLWPGMSASATRIIGQGTYLIITLVAAIRVNSQLVNHFEGRS